ncbi:MAG TPA: hypothetical protein VJT69_11830 [Pyrinomonadaceae bacterium]|nr:hypothetical protein [Pyrinomonadaceae bacterium]
MPRIGILLSLFIAAQVYAQPAKLINAGPPQPASIEGYHRGHCVSIPNRIRICKLLSDNADVFLAEKEGKTIGIWPSTAYMGETEDFEVLRGDLDGDRQPELIVANHDATGVGLGVSVYTITIFPNTDLRTFQSPLTFSVQEYGSLGTFVHTAGHINILTTGWVSGDDRRRGDGLYLVGQWWRYKSGELVPLLNRNAIARRYLFSFERERWETLTSDRIPYRWLANRNATTVTTEFVTGASTHSKGGVIQSVSTPDKSSYHAVKIAFQPDGEQASTFLYPSDEDDGTIDRYIGDATSGRIYPNRYLPSDPERWLTGKRATLRTYDDHRLEVLWLEPQKSTKGTK